MEQRFDLALGWNAAYLEVDPAQEDANTLFSALPVSAVWSRDESAAGAASVCNHPDDPNCTPAQESGWTRWIPPTDPRHVGGDGQSEPADLRTLVDCLAGRIICSEHQSDLDHSSRTHPRDILRGVDLLNGAEGYDVWRGRSLPEPPCH